MPQYTINPTCSAEYPAEYRPKATMPIAKRQERLTELSTSHVTLYYHRSGLLPDLSIALGTSLDRDDPV